jgi:glycosyltransferase involved in cell wall biosynthesis
MTTSIHVIGSRHSGGAEMFFSRLVNPLSDSGHGVSTITRANSMVSRELAADIEQAHVGMYNVRDPLSRMFISRIIGAKDPDIVQTYMGRATRLTRVPRGSHAIHVSRLGGFYKLDGYRHADAWVGNTRSICDYLIENRFPADRVFLIPNFVETGPPPPAEVLLGIKDGLNIPEEALIILGVGRFMEKKGFRHLIEAFSQLPDTIQGRPAHLLIAGSGPEEKKLISLASRLGIAHRVHWAGWQTDPGPYYALADVFVCPSLHEPLGNVILEAWSHEVPVISTRTHGALELIEDGVSGLLVPCGDSNAISMALVNILIQESEAAKGLAREGVSLLRQKYSKNTIVRSYLDLYDHLLAVRK